ncbi:MAG: hypothetical protein HYV28_17905 [Ignavibacteriales bacterium]|nr:hypothetical protein [Ignavibacteriales bacterium]
MRFKFAALFCLLFFYTTNAQHFSYYFYNDNHGLINNSVKTIMQDGLGFIWSGTDGGLALYDGRTFVTNNSTLPSTFIKNLYITRNKKLIVVTDLGIGYVERSAESFIYTSILKGSTIQNDTGLAFPKTIFEDSQGTIWVGDQTGIVKIKNNSYKKYLFEEQYRSDSYFRSFLFLEDERGSLIVSSWKGALFAYNKKTDTFSKLPTISNLKNCTIDDFQLLKQGTILTATNHGLLEIKYSDDLKSFSSTFMNTVPEISSFALYKNGMYLLTTWNSGVFLWNARNNTTQKLEGIIPRNINRVYKDDAGGMWLCTNEGLILCKETTFLPVLINSNIRLSSNYIRNLITDEKGHVYFSDQESIFKVSGTFPNFGYEKIHDSKGKRVYTFGIYKNCLWVSYRDGDFYFESKTKRLLIPKQKIGERLSSLKIDKNSNCWGVVERLNKIIVFDSSLSISFISLPVVSHQSQKLGINKNGDLSYIYADSLIYINKIDIGQKKLIPYNFQSKVKFKSSIILNDVYIGNNDDYYIGTNSGLFALKNNLLSEAFDSQENASKNFNAITFDNAGGFWIGTGNQLLWYNKGDVLKYTQQDGIPNSTISPEGLVTDSLGRIWVATAGGLAHLASQYMEVKKSPKPVLISFSVNQEQIHSLSGLKKLYGKQDIELTFSALCFPARVDYQYRIPGIRDSWSEASGGKLSFLSLEPGDYTIELRACQAGQIWSDVTSISFTIQPKWYAVWWMFLIYLAIIAIVIFKAAMMIQKHRIIRMEKERDKLERLVTEKTNALTVQNKKIEQLLIEANKAKLVLELTNSELVKANTLKNDLLGIASHDLKNPLSTIISYAQIIEELVENDAELTRISKIIFTAGMNMLRIITELLDSTMLENSNFKLEKSNENISELCRSIILNNKPRADLKDQDLIINQHQEISVPIDARWMREAIDNLISNALKYSPLGSTVTLDISEKEDMVLVSVTDQGPGLTDDDMHHLFQKFTRLSAKPTGGETSTGLGLSIVKEIMRLHNGDVIVKTHPGEGATFSLVIHK